VPDNLRHTTKSVFLAKTLLIFNFRLIIFHSSCSYLLLLLLFIIIVFKQGIYNYVTDVINISRVYTVAATLQLQFMANVMLFPTLQLFPYYDYDYSKTF
jgi:hypothetical protein